MSGILVILLLVQHTACNTGNPLLTDDLATTSLHSVPLFSELDTFIIENDTITFTPALAVLGEQNPQHKIFREDSITHRDDSGYVFKLQNGEQIKLLNVNDDDVESYKQYDEYTDMAKINQWLLHVSHYEWSTYELVDKSDGSITEIIDYPLVSPGHDKIIVIKEDLESGLEFNGIEYLKIKNKKIEPVWIRELTEISLSEARWVDNNTVVFKRVNVKTNKSDYVKVFFK